MLAISVDSVGSLLLNAIMTQGHPERPNLARLDYVPAPIFHAESKNRQFATISLTLRIFGKLKRKSRSEQAHGGFVAGPHDPPSPRGPIFTRPFPLLFFMGAASHYPMFGVRSRRDFSRQKDKEAPKSLLEVRASLSPRS